MRAAGSSAGPGAGRLLTVDEVAQWLQVKPRTIYQWVHEEYIPVIKLGALVRFDQGSVMAWVRKREAPGRIGRRLEFELGQAA
jgi:excisionase family DNA binding protein